MAKKPAAEELMKKILHLKERKKQCVNLNKLMEKREKSLVAIPQNSA